MKKILAIACLAAIAVTGCAEAQRLQKQIQAVQGGDGGSSAPYITELIGDPPPPPTDDIPIALPQPVQVQTGDHMVVTSDCVNVHFVITGLTPNMPITLSTGGPPSSGITTDADGNLDVTLGALLYHSGPQGWDANAPIDNHDYGHGIFTC